MCFLYLCPLRLDLIRTSAFLPMCIFFIFFAEKFAKPHLFIVPLHRISETPRSLLPNPVKLARTFNKVLTRF